MDGIGELIDALGSAFGRLFQKRLNRESVPVWLQVVIWVIVLMLVGGVIWFFWHLIMEASKNDRLIK